MSLLREYAGKNWHDWPIVSSDSHDDLSLPSSSSPTRSGVSGGDGGDSSASSRASSPPLSARSKDDSMKLPAQDMHVFGQCPVHDDFIVVVCETCSNIVKLQAFITHVKLRHAAILQPKHRSSSKHHKSNDLFASNTKSTVSKSKASPTPDKDLATTTQSSLSLKADPEPMDMDTIVPAGIAKAKSDSDTVVDLVDDDMTGRHLNSSYRIHSNYTDSGSTHCGSGSNTVIKLKLQPDEQLSQEEVTLKTSNTTSTKSGSSVNAMPSGMSCRSNVSSSSSNSSSSSCGSNHGHNSSTKPSPSKKAVNVRLERKPLREYHPDKHCGVWDNEANRHCTRALTCKSHSVVLKRKVGGRNRPFDELVAAHKKAQAVGTCTPVATAASSSSLASLAGSSNSSVICGSSSSSDNNSSSASSGSGASKGLNHQQQGSSCASTINPSTVPASSVTPGPAPSLMVSPSSSLASASSPQAASSVLQSALNGGLRMHGVRLPMTSCASSPSPVLTNYASTAVKVEMPLSTYPTKVDVIHSDSLLHYTTHHPKPLAVCTFGSKKIGGLLFSDRSRLFTRKLVRVAFTAPTSLGRNVAVGTGFQRIRPGQPHVAIVNGAVKDCRGAFVLNYNLSSNLKRKTIDLRSTVYDRPVGSSASPVPNMSLSTLPPGASIVIPDSFKTDMQDFKGGIKFELGQKIKHILPSGSDLPQ